MCGKRLYFRATNRQVIGENYGQDKSIFRSTSDDVKSQFKKSRCLLTISVGQATHEGELFAATMDLINASFKSCVLLIDDSLQRHTMAFNTAEKADFFMKNL